MTYIDPDRQKEFQRKWAREKAKKLAALIPAFDIKVGHPSWEEVCSEARLKKLRSLKECIKEASQFVVKGRTNRMAVAAIALRVCEINHGGARRGTRWDIDASSATLAAFADGIGVHRKTLWDWIDAYRWVAKNLPEDTKRVKYTSIREAQTWAKRTGEDPVELYKQFASTIDPRARVFEVVKRVRGAVFYLKKYGLEYFVPEELNLFEEWATLVYSLLPIKGDSKWEKPKPKSASTNSSAALPPDINTDGAMGKGALLRKMLVGAGKTSIAQNAKRPSPAAK